jgi:hypothetical protein
MNRRHGVDNQALKARRLVLENLTSGTVHAIQVRAVGGSAGQHRRTVCRISVE